jgi:hypothetical protein
MAALVLYTSTTARDIVVGDTPELATVAATLGVAHPPGYPLLTLVGHLFSLLPVGPIAFRINLMAAVCGAATVAIVYATALRLTRDVAAASVAAVAIALDPLLWSWSLVIESFPLNNLVSAALIFLLVVWVQQPERDGYLIAAAFAAGLGLSNHQTIVLFGPAVLWLLWTRRAHLIARPRTVAFCAAAFAAGLLPYASIPWAAGRHPFLSWGDVESWPDFIALILRKDYGTGQLVSAPEFQGGSAVARVLALGASFSLVEGPLVIAGAIEAFRRARWYFWFAALALLVAGPVFAAYANMDISKETALWVLSRFFLLPHVIAAPLAAFGVLLIVRAATTRIGANRSSLVRTAVVGAAVAGAVIIAARSYRDIDQRGNHIAGQYARDLLDGLAPNTLLIATGDEHIFPVAYVQAVEGRRPDVTLVFAPLMKAEWYRRLLRVRYPALRLPFDKPAAAFVLLDIVDSNQGRSIAVGGGLPDKSLEGKYGFIKHGLVNLVEPMSRSFDLVQIDAENVALLAQFHPPPPASIHGDTFEPQILRMYASPAEWMGTQYAKAGYRDRAAEWYRRAMQIDPAYGDARADLEKLTGTSR